MKRFFFFLFIILSLSKESQAQWVTIPDANFVTWLTANYPTCMSGNQMDTTCSGIVNETTVNCCCYNMHDLTGIQYFDNLDLLNCHHNQLTSIPSLPSSITQLFCDHNQLTSLPSLPNSISDLECQVNQLTSLPPLPLWLVFFTCDSNQLVSIPSLQNLVGLYDISCYSNSLTSLPSLPNSLAGLICNFNHITSLPNLPNSLTYLECAGNLILSLPVLPNSLTYLACDSNQLTALPVLPNSLQQLTCTYNFLTSLPALPDSLLTLDCGYNQLTSIPSLPDSIEYFFCNDNIGLTCLPQLNKIVDFEFYNTGITCLPNYPLSNTYIDPTGLPLCTLLNNSGCPVYWNITGSVYKDLNNDCIEQSAEGNLLPVKIRLSQGGNLIQQEYSTTGLYSFDTHLNTYQIEIDTTNFPFITNCFSNNSNDTTVTVTANDSLIFGVDFGMNCKNGFDIGVNSVVGDSGAFVPGRFCLKTVSAGDMSNFYGAHCAAGVGGTVVATFNGPVTYAGYKAGSLAPTTVNGNTVTWNIADFGSVNFNSDFHLRFHTDTSAQIGQQVCFTVSVTPTAGDNDITNNNWSGCFNVQTSFDPNEKEVSPFDTILINDWLTYTIHFQNTGTASAEHIYVDDTLDTDLDESSFQLLSYSVAPFVQIKGNAVRFNFPNINLPDSNANEPGSHGYVQYRIKPKNNLLAGTQIKNTAFIYFDFNPPVVTDTTVNTIVFANGVNQFQVSGFKFQVFPNPATDELNILFSQQGNYTVKITDAIGREMKTISDFGITNVNLKINISDLSSGIFFVEVKSKDGIATKRFVKG